MTCKTICSPHSAMPQTISDDADETEECMRIDGLFCCCCTITLVDMIRHGAVVQPAGTATALHLM